MNLKSIFNIMNWCFVFSGAGSINYNGNKWMSIFTFWRCCLILAHILHSRNGHEWVSYKNFIMLFGILSTVSGVTFPKKKNLSRKTGFNFFIQIVKILNFYIFNSNNETVIVVKCKIIYCIIKQIKMYTQINHIVRHIIFMHQNCQFFFYEKELSKYY